MEAPIGKLLNHVWDEFSVLLFWVCVYFFVYSVGFNVLFTGWKRKPRLDAASCCMSVIHGTVATLLAAYDLTRSYWNLDAPNTEFQNKLMEFSTAYFLVDLLHYILFIPEDFHFILHHIATSTVILSCRFYTRHGGISVMTLLLLGEMTSPVQNIWTLTGLASEHSTLARRIHHSVSPFFAVYFTFIRGVIVPLVTWKLCKYYLTGQADAVIPRWLAAYWMTTVFLAIAGSLLWAYNLWAELVELYLKKNVDVRVSKAE